MRELVSVQVGVPQRIVLPDGRSFRTSLYKQPVCGPVMVGKTDLAGNRQADLRYHGGADKAVCCFPLEHFGAMALFLGSPVEAGAMGENFTVQGMLEDDVCVGDQYRVCKVVVEVTQPRQPCSTLIKRWQNNELPGWLTEHGYSGWYFRVLKEGEVMAPAAIELLERPHPGWTIKRLNELMTLGSRDYESMEEVIAISQLSDAWRQTFSKRLASKRA